MGIGPWKDTIVYVSENYLQLPTDLVARAHALNLQVWFGLPCEILMFLGLLLTACSHTINQRIQRNFNFSSG